MSARVDPRCDICRASFQVKNVRSAQQGVPTDISAHERMPTDSQDFCGKMFEVRSERLRRPCDRIPGDTHSGDEIEAHLNADMTEWEL